MIQISTKWHQYLKNTERFNVSSIEWKSLLLNFRQLEHLNSRLTNDISSIFSLLKDNAGYQYSSLPSSNAHLLGNLENLHPSPGSLSHGDNADDTKYLLPSSIDATAIGSSPDNLLVPKDHTSSRQTSILPSKLRSSSAVNISCQTPQSIQSKRASSTSGGPRELLPGSQVE